MVSSDQDPPSRGALEQVPSVVRDALRLQVARPLSGGGTPAQVFVCDAEGDRTVVVKVLYANDGSVDGHDLQSFLRKPIQISRIHRELPGLSPFYVPVIGQWQGDGWGAYAMPRVLGASPTTLLQDGDPERFTTTMRSVFEVIGSEGYAMSTVPAIAGHGVDTHFDRLARRLPLLQRHLGSDVVGEARLRINGRLVPNARELLRRAAERTDVLAVIQPAKLYYPVHGDLNLGNILVRDPGPANEPRFTILDPRGVLDHWDPVYDAAKALFSLTLFDAAMSGGFDIVRDACGFEVALRSPLWPDYSVAAGLPTTLMSVGFFDQLSRTDPRWPQRLWFTHAFHVLSESACRLSDRTARELAGASGWAVRHELALGLYLSGLLLLDDLLSTPDVDPAGHLGCLSRLWVGR